MSDGQTADTQALVVAPPQRPRRRRRWLTLDRKRVEIVEALAMGESLRETARQIGVSYWTLIDYVRHEDVSAEIEAERERVRIAARESRLRYIPRVAERMAAAASGEWNPTHRQIAAARLILGDPDAGVQLPGRQAQQAQAASVVHVHLGDHADALDPGR